MRTNNSKLSVLKTLIGKYQKVIVAFSGGVDSTFLLNVCVDVLCKDNVIAVTAVSDSYTKHELMYAQAICNALDVEHIIIRTDEMSDCDFTSNTAMRCYHCKKHLFSELKHIAEERHVKYILDGSNVDDESDYRPGRRAAREFSVKSPLIEAGLTKDDIRKYSRMLRLDSWNRPANPCLASRIPYGRRISRDELAMVEKAETFLRKEGFKTVRVRHHGDIARIEVSEKDIKKLLSRNVKKRLVQYLKDLGFVWVAVDIEGYRTGSLNAALAKRKHDR